METAFKAEHLESLRPMFSVVPRDLEILNTIRRLAPVSRTQLQRLHFPCRHAEHHLYCDCRHQRGYGAVCRRLKRLREDGDLIAGHQLNRFHTPRQGMLYTLCPEYEKQVAIYESQPDTDPEKKKQENAIKDLHEGYRNMMFGRGLMLRHHLLINDLYIWWELSAKAARKHIPDLHLRCLIHEDIKALKLKAPVPDAIFAVRIRGKITQFYVEADRGTERVPRLRTKLFDYITVLRTSPNVFVLFVFHKTDRLQTEIVSMVSDVENEINKSGKYLTPTRISDRVWFSVYDQHHDLDRRPYIHSNALLDPIWVMHDDREKTVSGKFPLRAKVEFRVAKTG